MPEQIQPEQGPAEREPKALDYFCGFNEFQIRANTIIRPVVESILKKISQVGTHPIIDYFSPEHIEGKRGIGGFKVYMDDKESTRLWSASEVRTLGNLFLADELTLPVLLQPFNFNEADTNYWVARGAIQGFSAGPQHVKKYMNSPPGVFRAITPTEGQVLRAFVYLTACDEIDEQVEEMQTQAPQ